MARTWPLCRRTAAPTLRPTVSSDPPATDTSQQTPALAETGNAYFRSLSLRNVRCFGEQQQLNLEDGDGTPARWTLILGDNGTGKSTLLQLLALGAAVEEVPRRRGDKPSSSFLPRIAETFGLWRMIRSGEPTTQVRYRVLWADSLDRQATRIPDVSTIEGDRSSWICDPYYLEQSFMVYGYGANRRRAPSGLTAEASGDPTRTLFDDDATLRNPEEWWLQKELVANTPSPLQDRARQQREKVRDILTRILPGVDDIRLASHTTANQDVRANAEVHGPDGWIPFSALGLGYRTMTAWIVDFSSRLLERYGTLPDPLSGAAVCLVDEIDLHLHPRWQRDLIARLTTLFPNTQFIATAHSPLVVQAAPDANVVVLKRQGDGVVIDNAPRSVRKWRVDQILTSELFDIPSARAPELDEAIRERDEILAKPTLSDDDERRLAELRTVIGDLPHGDAPEDIEAMDVIRRAAKALQDKP